MYNLHRVKCLPFWHQSSGSFDSCIASESHYITTVKTQVIYITPKVYSWSLNLAPPLPLCFLLLKFCLILMLSSWTHSQCILWCLLSFPWCIASESHLCSCVFGEFPLFIAEYYSIARTHLSLYINSLTGIWNASTIRQLWAKLLRTYLMKIFFVDIDFHRSWINV